MKSSTVAVLAFAAFARASEALVERWGYKSPKHTIYFITNDATGNRVVSAGVTADGNLTDARSTSAGGVGIHGLGLAGADGTFSQGILQVYEEKNLLATVNPANNTAVLFSIDPFNPTHLTMLGKPVSTEGDFPNSVTFNDKGDELCVLNTGTNNGVACFDVTKHGLKLQKDSVRDLGLQNQTVPATGPFNTGSQLVWTQDQKNLLVAVKGTMEDPGFFAVWPSTKKGELAANYTRIDTPEGAGLPFSLTPVKGANAFMAVDFAIGFDVLDFSEGIDRVSSSPRTTAVNITGQMATCWSTYSPVRNSYYAIDSVGSLVHEVKFDEDLKGTLVNNFTVPEMSGAIDSVVVNVDGKDLFYSLLANTLEIGVWDLDSKPEPTLTSLVDLSSLTNGTVPFTSGQVQGLGVYTRKF
ncbi:unnamed protein product [Peniophora sp. CBMAI 1063]|nr:unnamed protein product [Peniophora sp. CBMAI 1063]